MKRIKVFVFFSVINLFVILFSLLLGSCQEKTIAEEVKVSNQFMSSLKQSIPTLMSSKIVVGISEKRKKSLSLVGNKKELKVVYIDFPNDTPEYYRKDVKELNTLDDMLRLSHHTAAEFTLEKNENVRDSIYLSETVAKEQLYPLVEKSKIYLLSKGFSEKDIEDMLKENNADETELVSFVLALTEKENKENSQMEIMSSFLNNPLPFVTSAKAYPTINWNKAGNCAIKALGVDIFYGLTQSNLKTWSVAMMKRAFKTVAKKVIGPIGVIICIGEFSHCYFM